MSDRLIKELTQLSAEINTAIDNTFTQIREPQILYEASQHLIHAGGKRLRPFLTLKACELVGGRREAALPASVAVELIHNFTIIHDDIMDQDSKRRGVPTVHVLWGVPLAINSGDLLFAKAHAAVLQSSISARRLLKIVATFTDATINICEGQALDMLFEKNTEVSEKQYLNMVYKKTAVLLFIRTPNQAEIPAFHLDTVEKTPRAGGDTATVLARCI